MATRIEQILEKRRAGQKLTPAEQAFVASVQGAQPAPGPAPASAENLYSEPGTFDRYATESLIGLGDAVTGGIASLFSNDAPAGYEDTAEFSLGFNPMMGFANPEIGMADRARLRTGFFLDRRPESRANMLRNTLGPEAVNISQDPLGNMMVALEGGDPQYLNAPGMSRQDVTDIADDFIKFMPAAGAANVTMRGIGNAPTVLSRLGRLAQGLTATSGSAAATEAGSQGLGQLFGSEQDIDWGDVMTTGAMASGGEALGMLGSRLSGPARDVMRQADDMGIDLRDSPRNQILSTRQRALGMAPGSPAAPTGRRRATPRGEGTAGLREGFEQAREETHRPASAQFDVARDVGRNAAVRQSELGDLQQRVANVLDEGQFDIPETGQTRRILNALDQLATPPSGASPENVRVRLNALENWRRRATARAQQAGRSKVGTGPQEATALGRSIRAYDDWIEDQFTRDLVSGDAEAVQAWRQARDGWRSFKERFDGNKLLNKMREQDELTPEGVRNVIFNSANLPSNDMAADAVRVLNDTLGPDSPQMNALRAEVAADITAPLFEETPDIAKFARNYDQLVDKQPTLMQELFPDTLDDLHTTARLARGIGRQPGAEVNAPDSAFDAVRRYATASIVGHGIAQGGARMELSRQALSGLRRATAGRSQRKAILHDFLGTDPTQRLTPAGVGAEAGAVTSSQMRDRATGVDDAEPVSVQNILQKLRNGQPLTEAEQRYRNQLMQNADRPM